MTNTAELTVVRLQPHELEASLRFLPAITDAVNQLIYPRLVHTEIHNEAGGIDRIHTEEHPALVDLLQQGTGGALGSRYTSTKHTRIPIDAEANRIWNEIRARVGYWLNTYDLGWTNDLKHDLATWLTHHEDATLRGNITPANQTVILRQLDGWVDRIDGKYDPDEKREWKDPCPALLNVEDDDGNVTGVRRCGAHRILNDAGEQIFAVELNVSRRRARCRRCRTTWEGERGLMQLRLEANHYDEERRTDAD